MVRLWSTPRHHDDERQQHAIVSIKPHFYGEYFTYSTGIDFRRQHLASVDARI